METENLPKGQSEKDIKFSNKKPPVYDTLFMRFGADWDKGLIIAWDGTIHSKEAPLAQKIVHEMVHIVMQRKMGNELWWKCYIEDEVFRLKEEKLAYKAEADFLKRNIKNREHRFKMMVDVAEAFASGIYGGIITKQQALAYLLK